MSLIIKNLPTSSGIKAKSIPPTYILTRSVISVNEGSNFTITLTTTNVINGTVIPYTITGVTSADIEGANLIDSFMIVDGVATKVFTVTADAITEGVETFTLTLNGGLGSISVTVNDTSLTPTYSLSRSAVSVNEGQGFTVTLDTTGLSNGTNVPYTITGVTTTDINGESLTGNFTINNNTSTINFTTTADLTTEGTEVFTLSLNGGLGSITVTINDTSTSTPTDTSWSNVNFLANFESNYANVASSGGALQITGAGVSRANTAGPFGGSSYYAQFNGTTSATLAYDNSADQYRLATVDFTIDGWFYITSYLSPSSNGNAQMILATYQWSGGYRGGWGVTIQESSQKLSFTDGTSSTVATNIPALNTWHHFAVTRQGTVLKLWMDGVLEKTGTCVASIPAQTAYTKRLRIGSYTTDSQVEMNTLSAGSRLDEIRITPGVIRYTGTTYTVPIAPNPVG